MKDAFWELYTGLDREGPGQEDDVTWAARLAFVPPDGRICDAGCGSGGDIPTLLALAPEGHVTAVDRHRAYIDHVLARFGDDRRVTAYKGDIGKLKGPFEFIWCAGAIYFLGIRKALRSWRPALAKGGTVAFSHPAFFTAAPSEAARVFWGDHAAKTEDEIAGSVAKAGYVTLGTRILSDSAWERYYQPLEARIARLRIGASPAMTAVLDMSEVEIETWRAVRAETGYLLSVVRPA